MTLVYRAQKYNNPPPEDSPGPTSYASKTKPNKVTPSSVFLSKVARDEHSPINQPVSPINYQAVPTPKEQLQPSSVFRSTIERFKTEKENKPQENHTFSEELNTFMRKQPHSEVPGKIISSQERKEKEKEMCPQRLPSIPGQQNSYGYKYDPLTHQLVHNDSPKIMFAKRLTNSHSDFHFQRTQSQLGKGHGGWVSQSKRAPLQLEGQRGGPPSTQYNPHQTSSIEGTMKHCANTVTSFREKSEESVSPRDKLLLMRIKRQFRGYLPENITLQQLKQEKLKPKQRCSPSSSPQPKSKKKQQFFLAKQQRFRVVKQKIEQRFRESDNRDSQDVQKRKEPLGLGAIRFKESSKENMGPGSYDFSIGRGNSCSIVGKEQRFKGEDARMETPGPGAYQTKQGHSKYKLKMRFNHFSSNSLKKEQENIRQSSMENLYEKVGRHLNYMQKSEKVGRKAFTHQKLKKGQKVNMMGLARAQQDIKKAITQDNQIRETEYVQKCSRGQSKKQHLYEYQKPTQYLSPLGPGCYQIATSLDKRSFNQSPAPVYSTDK